MQPRDNTKSGGPPTLGALEFGALYIKSIPRWEDFGGTSADESGPRKYTCFLARSNPPRRLHCSLTWANGTNEPPFDRLRPPVGRLSAPCWSLYTVYDCLMSHTNSRLCKGYEFFYYGRICFLPHRLSQSIMSFFYYGRICFLPHWLSRSMCCYYSGLRNAITM